MSNRLARAKAWLAPASAGGLLLLALVLLHRFSAPAALTLAVAVLVITGWALIVERK
ncbi:hypothetical protein Maq22A_c13310 [Methylobacterium aquaticum]|jgi:hypothetical protein|uniref:Uncharacterized protein n=1 Tax=Methylobacterium aquaticum TaxID=270351 RepID=A0A0C6FFU9_9HYPH|nr:hypothetical protein Maq22A_c13310 [Methylobacterium aquaticum]